MKLVIPLCVSYAAYCLVTMPGGPVTTPDSAHYLSFSTIVPLGYPFFLSVVGARGAMFVQPLLYAGALAFLGREILRVTGRTPVAVTALAAGMLLPQVTAFHSAILSESLFLTTVIVFLGLTIWFVRQPSWHLMVPIATLVGISATIRRTGFALLPVLVIMVLLQRHKLRGSQPALFFVAAVAPFAFIIATEQVIAPIVHGGDSSSLMGRHLFAKAALVDAPPSPRATDPLRAALDEHLEISYAPIRQLLARAPSDVRAVLAIFYETCLQGGCVDRSRAVMPDWPESRQTTALGAAGAARLARAPLAFAKLTTLNVGSLWTVDRLRHPDTAVALRDFVEANRPLPFEREALRLEPGEPMRIDPSPRVRYVQYAISALGLATAGLAALGLIALWKPQLPPVLAAACLAALAAHGSLVFTALLAAGFSRFTLGLWPAITTAAILGAYSLLKAGGRR
jgi:hypothetical protein